MKKTILFFLVFTLAFALLASCEVKEDPNDNSSETVVEESTDNSYKDEKGLYQSKLPVKDWDEKEFKILVRGETFDTYQSEDFTTNSTLYGDLLNDAVSDRNNYVEEKFNVKLVVYKSDSIDSDIRNEAAASTGEYHAIMPALNACAVYAQNGYLYDLNEISNFDLDAPWWDKRANEAFTIGGKLYFTTGDITILNKVNAPSILFNKDMIHEYGLENPYDLVNSHKWTFDKMVEMAKSVTQINTPDGSISPNNIYGLLTANGDALVFYGAAGEKLCEKDTNDLPYLSLGNERSITVAQKVLSTLQAGEWAVLAQEFEAPIWDTSFAYFHEGRVLFRPSVFSATTKARQRSELMFGILPLPLWAENQEKYNSYCDVVNVAGLAIMKTCPDIEFATYMIEMYAAEAKNVITPAYYEVNLRYKDTTDEESLEMLDIIFENIVYDVGRTYNFGRISYLISELMTEKSADVVSKLDSAKDSIINEIDKTISNFSFD